jgi:acyl dehydratase
VAVDAALARTMRSRIGATERESLGTLTESLIRRYARAVEDDNPLYHDAEYARSLGLSGVMAPPNLVPSVVSWTEGASSEHLRPDGTEVGTHLPGLPTSGVRVMGGGEEMWFHRPACAGMDLHLETRLESVEEREGKTGPMLILCYHNSYTDRHGNPVVTTYRTVLL